MKKNYYICLSMLLWLSAFLLIMGGLRRKSEALASRISPEILRFHVLANSDSDEDQAVKLLVKDMLLDEIRWSLSPENAASRAGICDHIMKNRAILEQKTDRFLADCGMSYRSEIRLEHCLFPEKTYGDMTFPAGTYDAVRVMLGNGRGRNFWCVLYPSLCYLDSTHAIVPEESKELLRALIPEDDFYALLQARRKDITEKTEQESILPRVNIRFQSARRIQKLLSVLPGTAG